MCRYSCGRSGESDLFYIFYLKHFILGVSIFFIFLL